MGHRHSRRSALKLLGAGIAAAWWMPHLSLANSGALLRKPIPGGGQLPVIGLGTWQTFNVGSDPQLLDARTEVVRAFFEHGGGLVDSSPMYGSAPDVMGYALDKLGKPDSLYTAEKVWSPAGGNRDARRAADRPARPDPLACHAHPHPVVRDRLTHPDGDRRNRGADPAGRGDHHCRDCDRNPTDGYSKVRGRSVSGLRNPFSPVLAWSPSRWPSLSRFCPYIEWRWKVGPYLSSVSATSPV